jgi:hypothetical protein
VQVLGLERRDTTGGFALLVLTLSRHRRSTS